MEQANTVDIGALTMLCNNYDTYLKCAKILRDEGYFSVNGVGATVPHPAIRIMTDAQRISLRIVQEFGLTSLSRKRLKKKTATEEEQELSPLESFVKNKLV